MRDVRRQPSTAGQDNDRALDGGPREWPGPKACLRVPAFSLDDAPVSWVVGATK